MEQLTQLLEALEKELQTHQKAEAEAKKAAKETATKIKAVKKLIESFDAKPQA